MPIESLDYNKPLSVEPLNEKSEPLINPPQERQITCIVKCRHSIYKKDLFFHNRLSRKDKSAIVDSIKSVLKLDGVRIKSDSIPFEEVEGFDGRIYLPENREDKERMIKILSEYDTSVDESKLDRGGLVKYSPLAMHKVKGDVLRYIVDNDGENWIVLLIDTWHLFATANYREIFKEHKNNEDTRFDIKDLLK